MLVLWTPGNRNHNFSFKLALIFMLWASFSWNSNVFFLRGVTAVAAHTPRDRSRSAMHLYSDKFYKTILKVIPDDPTGSRGYTPSWTDSGYSEFYCRHSGGYTTLRDFYALSCAQCFAFIFPENELVLYKDRRLISHRYLLHLSSQKRAKNNLAVIDESKVVNTTPTSVASADRDLIRSKNASTLARSRQTFDKRILQPDWQDSLNPIYAYLKDEKERNSWRDCCRTAQHCCETHKIEMRTAVSTGYVTHNRDYSSDTCPATWDGWQCWPESKPNTKNYLSCPGYIHGGKFHISLDSRVFKICQPNGTWFSMYNPHTDLYKEWSNYSQCLKIDLYYRRQYVRLAAYIISILAIIPALLIYKIFNLLHTARVMLHANLMISFLLKAITVIIFDILYVSQGSAKISSSTNNQISSTVCNCVAFFNKYFLLSTYCWMFNEGFYLYTILIFAMKIKTSLKTYLLFGWGFPIIPVIIYVLVKRVRDKNGCWIMNVSNLDWIINSICIIILLINVIFLIQIIRLIVIKLKSGIRKEQLWYRQMVKAVIFLIPLFGVQILFTLYRPSITNGFSEAYHSINSLLEGLQGFFIALIFCYLNGEVLAKLRARWRRESDERMTGVPNHKSLLLT